MLRNCLSITEVFYPPQGEGEVKLSVIVCMHFMLLFIMC